MSAKTEAKEAPAAAAAPEKAAGSKAGGLLPVILAVVLAPVLSWAVIEFVLFPRLLKKAGQTTVASAEHAEEAHAAPAEEKHEAKAVHGEGKESKSGTPANAYEFTNVVVNLSGTMGTRYLKTSFIVTGKDAIKGIFEADKARLTDVTLGVLSSLSLSDLEEPASKNILRERLVGAYNQTLGRKVAEQVYFSDFVVQ